MAIYNDDKDPNIFLINDMNGEEPDQITEALDYLESQGFYVHNLWHIQDVQDKFDCTEKEAFTVLDDAVSGEWIIEQINERILDFGKDNNLKGK